VLALNYVSAAKVYWSPDQQTLSAFTLPRMLFVEGNRGMVDEAFQLLIALSHGCPIQMEWEGLMEDAGNHNIDDGFFSDHNPLMRTLQHHLPSHLVNLEGVLVVGSSAWNPTFMNNWMKMALKLNNLLMIILCASYPSTGN
jgi:hypothetical protein